MKLLLFQDEYFSGVLNKFDTHNFIVFITSFMTEYYFNRTSFGLSIFFRFFLKSPQNDLSLKCAFLLMRIDKTCFHCVFCILIYAVGHLFNTSWDLLKKCKILSCN